MTQQNTSFQLIKIFMRSTYLNKTEISFTYTQILCFHFSLLKRQISVTNTLRENFKGVNEIITDI